MNWWYGDGYGWTGERTHTDDSAKCNYAWRWHWKSQWRKYWLERERNIEREREREKGRENAEWHQTMCSCWRKRVGFIFRALISNGMARGDSGSLSTSFPFNRRTRHSRYLHMKFQCAKLWAVCRNSILFSFILYLTNFEFMNFNLFGLYGSRCEISFIFVRLSNKVTKIDFFFLVRLSFCHHHNSAGGAKRNETWIEPIIIRYTSKYI